LNIHFALFWLSNSPGEKSLSNRSKLDEAYKNSTLSIERAVQTEIEKVHQETDALKQEAAKIGEAVESSLNATQLKITQKKVNS
jgi:hypothetical protein